MKSNREMISTLLKWNGWHQVILIKNTQHKFSSVRGWMENAIPPQTITVGRLSLSYSFVLKKVAVLGEQKVGYTSMEKKETFMALFQSTGIKKQ